MGGRRNKRRGWLFHHGGGHGNKTGGGGGRTSGPRRVAEVVGTRQGEVGGPDVGRQRGGLFHHGGGGGMGQISPEWEEELRRGGRFTAAAEVGRNFLTSKEA